MSGFLSNVWYEHPCFVPDAINNYVIVSMDATITGNWHDLLRVDALVDPRGNL